MKKIALALAVCSMPVLAQESLTPPGMPPLRPVQERPVEVQREPERPQASQRTVEESGSLSFAVPRVRTEDLEEPSTAPAEAASRQGTGGAPRAGQDAPVALTPAAPAPGVSMTTRPVEGRQDARPAAMPPLSVQPAGPRNQANADAGRVAAQNASPTNRAPAEQRPSGGAASRAPGREAGASASQREEIERLEAEVAAARARLPAAPQGRSANVGGGQIPPSELSVKPGQPVVFNIARQHLNRIVTPFPVPFVKTTSEATTATIEGRIVYIATASDAPISLFIGDESDPVNAVVVTAVPRDIPAVQVKLDVEGFEPTVARPINAEKAADFELSQPFLQTIRELFRELATGSVPSGFGMSPLRGSHPMMPDCPMSGIRMTPMQEISGSQFTVIVAKAQNTSSIQASINEEMCASDHVVAVAAWPRRVLLPGQATEVFIAVRRPEERSQAVRPSVLMGGSNGR